MPLSTFLIATLALNLAPGPDMTYVAARSIGQGRRAGIVSALGVACGCLVHVAAAAAGVAMLLRAWPHAYVVVRLVGAGDLVYLGIGLLRQARTAGAIAMVPRASGARDLPAGRRHQRAEPEGGAVLPRVPAAVRRSGARAGGAADSGARPAVRRLGHDRQRRGGVSGRRCARSWSLRAPARGFSAPAARCSSHSACGWRSCGRTDSTGCARRGAARLQRLW